MKKLRGIFEHRATVLEAPPGYGKTAAVRYALSHGAGKNKIFPDARAAWFTAWSGELPEAAWARLCEKIRDIAPEAGARLLALGFPTPGSVGRAADALSLLDCPKNSCLVVDDAHRLIPLLPDGLLGALSSHECPGLCVVFSGVRFSADTFARKNSLHRIDADDLALCAEDVARCLGCGDGAAARSVFDLTRGWYAAVVHQRLRIERGEAPSHDERTLRVVREQVWDALGADARDALVSAALLSRFSPDGAFTERQLRSVARGSGTGAAELGETPFVRREGEALSLHPGLAALLLHEHERADDADRVRRSGAVGRWFAKNGAIAPAFELLREAGEREAIFALPLTSLRFARMGEESLTDAAWKILRDSPAPSAYSRGYALFALRVAYALLAEARKREARAAMRIAARAWHAAGISKWERRRFYAEWAFVRSIFQAPDLPRMLRTVERAARRVDRIEAFDASEPFMFGLSGTFVFFHRKLGEADREADLLERYVSAYARLTGGGGRGADILFRSELAYYRGDIQTAERLAHAASAIALQTAQDGLRMGAARLLAEISMFRNDVGAFNDALEALRAPPFHAGNAPYCEKMVALNIASLFFDMGSNDATPDWLLAGGAGGFHTYRDWERYLIVRHVLRDADEAAAFGACIAALDAIDEGEIFFRALIHFFLAGGEHFLRNSERAAAHLRTAGEILNPDGLYLFYGSFFWYMPTLITDYLAELPKEARNVARRWAKPFNNARAALRRSFARREMPDSLTTRERQVAQLAADGMRNREIAEKLHLSPETVRTHLASIYRKLDIDRRSRIAEKLRGADRQSAE